MIVIPAIDIIDAKPVRLYQGDYQKKEVVASSVKETALSFENSGAQWIHIVDLDGAKQGKPVNVNIILSAVEALNVPIEAGGGIRTMEDIDMYLTHGISRVILGTSAINDEQLLKNAITKYGEKIAVGMDCKDGNVMVEGWLKGSRMNYISFAKHLEDIGVKNLIFTDISKDGTLMGPNIEMLRNLQEAVQMNIVASGGIKDLSHIQALKQMNLYGCITGKAIYCGSLDLKQAILEARV